MGKKRKVEDLYTDKQGIDSESSNESEQESDASEEEGEAPVKVQQNDSESDASDDVSDDGREMTKDTQADDDDDDEEEEEEEEEEGDQNEEHQSKEVEASEEEEEEEAGDGGGGVDGEEDEDEEMEESKPSIAADDDEEEEIVKKKTTDSDSSDESDDGETKRPQAADADDVLADLDLDDDDDEEEEEPKQQYRYTGDDDRDEREEEQPEEIPITRIEVEIPKIPNELGNDIHFVKLPNFLSVDTHPYDPSWYEDEIDEDEIMDEEGRHRLKLKVESTIRWRTVPDENGESRKESNARIVKWSDGSMSLHLGSEIFDIHKQSLMAGDNNHLFIRQGTGLQGQAVFKTKLTFRPHSTDSFTHRKMTLSLAERSHKTQKIRVLPSVGKDPEAHRSEMIKKEEDKLKASIRRENKMRRVREKAPFRGPTASYLEPDAYDEDDDDGGVSLSAIKKRYKKGGAGYNIYTDSDDDSDDIEKKKGPSERKRTAKMVESDDDD